MALTVLIGTVSLLLGLFAWFAFSPTSSIMPWRVKTSKKVVAITFDDGPNEPYTTQIANLFESYGGKATFFVVGKNCERFPGVVKDLQARGHQIGAHSYSHAFHRYITDPRYKAEIAKTKQVLAGEGVQTTLYRFPWLFRTPWLLASVRAEGYGVPVSGLFSHPLEPFQVHHKRIIRRTLKIAKPGRIIIFHDGFNAQAALRTETVAAVREVLAELDRAGYRFVTVKELLTLKD